MLSQTVSYKMGQRKYYLWVEYGYRISDRKEQEISFITFYIVSKKKG